MLDILVQVESSSITEIYQYEILGAFLATWYISDSEF